MDSIEGKDQSDEFYLLSAIRYDTENGWRESKQPNSDLDVDFESPLFLLSYHLDRLRRAAEVFGWEKAVDSLKGDEILGRLRAACEETVTSSFPDKTKDGKPASYKIRLLVNKSGDQRLEVVPIGRRPYDLLNISSRAPREFTTWPTQYAPILSVYLDTAPTPSSDFTSNKTTRRDHYKQARERVGIKSPDVAEEVVLYNENGEITEGSLRNIAVYRDGSWVTPPLASGCLGGVVRAWMLKYGRVKEAKIMKDELKEGEWVLTANGVEGNGLGIFKKSRS